MKAVIVAFLAFFSVGALADSYMVKQYVHAPETAINVADINKATKVEQVAQNVGNTATIKDLDTYGGDSYGSWQAVKAPQTAKNYLTARNVKTKIEQTAINFGSDLTIKDAGGAGPGFGFPPQSVVADQFQSGPQTAINNVTLYDPQTITQVAANTANTIDINLPSTPAVNSVSTVQNVVSPQTAKNYVNVPYVGNLSQTAANAGNAVKIVQ